MWQDIKLEAPECKLYLPSNPWPRFKTCHIQSFFLQILDGNEPEWTCPYHSNTRGHIV